MFYEYKGRCVSLRSVTLDDAEFIVALRNKEINTSFINRTSTDVNKQIEWMESEAQDASSHYFMILNMSGLLIGTISLYNILKSHGEFGRWICNGSSLESLESALLIHQYAFDVLGLKTVYTRTLANNHKVVNFHRKFGAKVPSEACFEPEYDQDIFQGMVNATMFPEIQVRCQKMIEALL